MLVSIALTNLDISRNDWNSLTHYLTSDSFTGELISGNAEFAPARYGVAPLPLFKTPDIRETFNNIAAAMTNQLRVTTPGSQVGFGMTNHAVGFVRVAWAYLILPLIVAVMSALLLALMIINSRRSRGVPLWKNSLIALLYHTVNATDGTIVGTYQSPRVLDGVARRTKVKLE
jgi:hypothetical protein